MQAISKQMPNLGKTARRHGKHLRFWGCATPESHVAVGGGGGERGLKPNYLQAAGMLLKVKPQSLQQLQLRPVVPRQIVWARRNEAIFT